MPTQRDTSEGRDHVAWQLADQGRVCAGMGSPLYARLLIAAADDVGEGGPVWQLLAADVRPGRGDAVALRLMAAVHRLVLTGRAPQLAAHYPSVGGDAARPGAWDAFREVLTAQADDLQTLVRLPCQTNEVGRCAPLAGGFFAVAARTGLPLRLLEAGASGGLNLRWDHYRYGHSHHVWGDVRSPVDLTGLWTAPPPVVAEAIEVTERRGCDRQPLDPDSEEDRLRLLSSVWADQPERVSRLRGALEVAARVPAVVDQAGAGEWLPHQLAVARPGVVTVVFHSIVEEYLDTDELGAFHGVIRDAGARATAESPLAWLRLEPLDALRHHGVTLTLWPGGRDEILATSGAHGQDVRWL